MSSSEHPRRDDPSSFLYDVEVNDPEEQLIKWSGQLPGDTAQITEVMTALGRLRDAEQELNEASQRYMRLGRTDMRALHYLMVAGRNDSIITPSALAAHLRISTASVTKMLDRLESAGHIQRAPHPSDRRALAITITEATREVAMNTVGRLQAKRFHAAARLTAAERRAVIKFLDDMTEEISLKDEPWAQP